MKRQPAPYVGPRAFEEDDRRNFFGRDREVEHLLSLVVARHAILLYSPSGAGKSSLLKAGLIPRLRDRLQVGVMPMVRLCGEVPPWLEGAGDGNLYVFDTLCELLDGDGESEVLWGLSLSDGLGRYLEAQPEKMRARPHLWILDQFEELFTTHPDRYAERADFFGQLRESLLDFPQVRLLLSMREEHLGELYPFEAQLPDRLRCRIRLGLLDEQAACAAVIEPARRSGIAFSADAARSLVDDLRRIRVQAADGGSRERLGPCVEPAQLQVACRRLWEKLPPGSETIDRVHLEAVGKVEQALVDYYAEQVASIAAATGIPQRSIRDWFEHQLITEQGIRAQVLRRAERSQGLANPAIEALVDVHLVRAEKRRGATWFELAHDRLIDPVRADNAAWSDANLNALQRQAAVWESEGRPGDLILRGDAFAAAERWVADEAPRLTPAEGDFLDACRRARAAAQRRYRQARRLRRYALGTTALSIVAGLACLVALYFFNEARSERDLALVRGLAAQATARIDDRLDLALLLGIEISRMGDETAGRRILLAGLESSPRLRRLLDGHDGTVWSVAFRPDGGLLASAGADRTIRLWEPATGRSAGEPLTGHRDWVWSVAFHPGGKRLASAGRDGAVVVWDLNAHPPRGRPLGGSADERHQRDVFSVAWSPDGRTLASAGWDGTILLWDVMSGTPGARLRGHADWVTSVAWSPDGRTLASGSLDGRVILWQPSSGLARESLDHGDWVTSVAWSPDGGILATGSLTGTVILWDPLTAQPLDRALEGLGDAVSSVAWSSDGRILAAGNVDGTVMLWDVASRRPLGMPLTGQTGTLRGVTFHPGGVLASGNGSAVVLWDVAAGRRAGCRLCTRRFRLPADALSSAALSLGGETLAAGRGSGIELWDVASGELRAQASAAHRDRVSSLAWSPDGRTLGSGSWDRTVVLRNPVTGRVRSELRMQHSARVSSLAFSPGGETLAVGDWDGAIVLWRTTGRRLHEPLVGHRDRVSGLAFSRDGRLLASGGWDQTVRLWDVETGRETGRPLTGHLGPVLSLAFAPNARILATGSWDGEIRLWEMATGVCLGGLHGHAERVVSLTYSLDGRTLVSADLGATVIRWDVDPGSWRDRACRIANRNLTVDEWSRFFGPGVAYRATCQVSDE